MPQKSIEQYERELMEMYQKALSKDPDYAALARGYNVAAQPDNTSEKIDVVIPAPGVEEVVPLPKGIIPVPTGQTDLPAPPPAVAVVLPVPERALSETARPAAETTAERDLDDSPDGEVVIGDEADLTVEGEDAAAPMPAPNIGAGRLIVNVTTQNRTLPVAQALVTVRHSDESGDRAVATVRTDSSGKTEPIRLPAPVREIPVYPQPMIGGDQSADYLVDIEAPGFETVLGETVLIFDGVTSVKRIDLVAEPNGVPDADNAAAEDLDGAQRV